MNRFRLSLFLLASAVAAPLFAEDLYNDFLTATHDERVAMMLDATLRTNMALRVGTPPKSAHPNVPPRWYEAEGVKNFRDLGGWTGLGGRKVRLGRIYRSSHFGHVKDPAGFVRRFGVRTDLDLRNEEETAPLKGRSPLGKQVQLQVLPMKAYDSFRSEKNRQRFGELFKLFLDEANYPIAIHCAKGADRTGSIVFFLNGLLGVQENELVLDWELTAFSNPNPKFRDKERVDQLVEIIRAEKGSTWTERMESFAKSCGIKKEEIARFREMMLEPLPTLPGASQTKDAPIWQVDGLLPGIDAKFASREEEKAAVDAVLAPIAHEPEPVAKIVYRDGMPFFSVNGELMEADINQSGDKIAFALNGAVKAASVGFRVHQLSFSCNDYEKSAGVYDFGALDRRIGRFLLKVPDARLILLVQLDFPQWLKAHPDAVIGYGTGPINEGEKGVGDERVARVFRPSAASRDYREEVRRFLTEFGKYVRARAWGRRVIGVRPCWGIYTEWHQYGMYDAADCGPAMTAAFRRWKNGLYAKESVPTAEERKSPEDFFLEPEKHRKLIDYYLCQANEIADFMLECGKTVKEALPGRLAGMYYGYVLAVHPPEGSNVLLEKVLSSPYVDFLSNPSMYNVQTRRAGGAYYPRTIPASFHRYGKLSILEDDMRFHHLNGYLRRGELICTATPQESEMTMRRDWLNRHFDGTGIQILDPSLSRKRPFSFDSPFVWKAIVDSRAALGKAGPRGTDSKNDVAVVVDWRERFKRPGDAHTRRSANVVYAEVPPWLFASGAAFDIMTLDDFLAQPEARYRKAVFLNCISPEPEMKVALRRRVSRKGFRSVWLLHAPFDVSRLEARVFEKVPAGVRAWRKVFSDLGSPLFAPEGHCVRRFGDLLMFHTGKIGTQRVDFVGYKGAVELFSGRRYGKPFAELETDGPATFLFKMTGGRR